MALTTFIDLIRRDGVKRIEIPIIQRDYAQGRRDRNTERIRTAFIEVLHDAVTEARPVHLDFIYGEVRDGTLIPLDGQQRLTALFLLHWYLAARAEVPNDESNRLPALAYATRYSSRVFCVKLPEQRPFPFAQEGRRVSDWLRDRNWFVRAWRHDPTIASMLVVLDELHARFENDDCQAAWKRLTDLKQPSITFHFQPIADLGLTDDLYIKMNSRGKPLTSFESFKAEFEDIVRSASLSRYSEICTKIDNQWSDLFWRERSKDDAIDDRFLNYLRFVIEMAAGLSNLPVSGDDLDKARQIFGSENARRQEDLAFLFDSFDVWTSREAESVFSELFTAFSHEPGKVVLFDQEINLFRTACAGSHIPIAKRLLLCAILRYLRDGTPSFVTHLRTLRNLVLNSELREQDVPLLLRSTSKILDKITLTDVKGFSANQLAEEEKKAELLANYPELSGLLQRVEDHWLLRGSLASIDLDETTFEHRATLFMEVFSGNGGGPVQGLRAAMLACGDYSFQNQSGKFQFGTERRELWRQLLTRKRAREVLRRLLDALPESDDVSITERLEAFSETFLVERERADAFNWRYYLVKYPAMLCGESGLYVGSNGAMGFDLCMLDKTTLNGWYRDPYLYALANLAGVDMREEISGLWFKGHMYEGRWLKVEAHGAKIRSVPEGWQIQPPEETGYEAAFIRFCGAFDVEAEGLVGITQVMYQGALCDTQDRIQLGSRLLRALVDLTPT